MKFVSILILIAGFTSTAFPQASIKPVRLDEFGNIGNDELQARFMIFKSVLAKDGSTGVVVLKGPALVRYFNQRRIIGCSKLMRIPLNSVRFEFSDIQERASTEFWKVPKGYESTGLAFTEPDYKLNLPEPVEMTVSMAYDDFCPRFFGLDWYAKFLDANPTLIGRAVIDVRTKKEFLSRVVRYRKELLGYGVAANRIRYYHKHFHGEHDEQFWLIPSKK